MMTPDDWDAIETVVSWDPAIAYARTDAITGVTSYCCPFCHHVSHPTTAFLGTHSPDCLWVRAQEALKTVRKELGE